MKATKKAKAYSVYYEDHSRHENCAGYQDCAPHKSCIGHENCARHKDYVGHENRAYYESCCASHQGQKVMSKSF